MRIIQERTPIPILFRVDTGADFTTISKKSLQKLGAEEKWVQENGMTRGEVIKTASSEESADFYVPIPYLEIMGFKAQNYLVGVAQDIERKPEQHYGSMCNRCNLTRPVKRDYMNLLGVDLLSYYSIELGMNPGDVRFKPNLVNRHIAGIYITMPL